jgi:hypothetical protein
MSHSGPHNRLRLDFTKCRHSKDNGRSWTLSGGLEKLKEGSTDRELLIFDSLAKLRSQRFRTGNEVSLQSWEGKSLICFSSQPPPPPTQPTNPHTHTHTHIRWNCVTTCLASFYGIYLIPYGQRKNHRATISQAPIHKLAKSPLKFKKRNCCCYIKFEEALNVLRERPLLLCNFSVSAVSCTVHSLTIHGRNNNAMYNCLLAKRNTHSPVPQYLGFKHNSVSHMTFRKKNSETAE